MELPLDPAVLGAVEKMPIAAGTSVIAPMRDCRRVTQNRIERDLGLLLVAKVFRPCINLFLAGRIPWHFAAEGIFFILPALGALSHAGFQGIRLRLHTFTLQIEENLKEYVALHLAEHLVTRRKIG